MRVLSASMCCEAIRDLAGCMAMPLAAAPAGWLEGCCVRVSRQHRAGMLLLMTFVNSQAWHVALLCPPRKWILSCCTPHCLQMRRAELDSSTPIDSIL